MFLNIGITTEAGTIQYQLSDDEGNDKQKAGSFTERPTAGASDKYQGLADGADLKIQS